MKQAMTDTLVLREDDQGLGVYVGNRAEIAEDGSWESKMYVTYDLAQVILSMKESS